MQAMNKIRKDPKYRARLRELLQEQQSASFKGRKPSGKARKCAPTLPPLALILPGTTTCTGLHLSLVAHDGQAENWQCNIRRCIAGPAAHAFTLGSMQCRLSELTEDEKKELEAQVDREVTVQGGRSKPALKDTLVVQLFLLPWSLAKVINASLFSSTMEQHSQQ